MPEYLKGRNKTSFCLYHFPNTTILLLSYKNGSSFLCQFAENEKQKQLVILRISVLDAPLQRLKLEALVCAPRLIHASAQQMVFSALLLKHSHLSN